MRWLAFELRWREELCRAALPEAEGRDRPAWIDVDADEVWQRFDAVAPRALRHGWRAMVWVVQLRPMVRRGRPHRFGTLSPAEQALRLSVLNQRESRVGSQLASAFRLVVCIAYLSDGAARTRTTNGSIP
jgi:hypothetical protein